VWDELELFELGDLHVILIFFSLDSSIVFLTFKLLKISFLISVFTFVDLEAEPHILDLKREREREREREKAISSSNGGGIERDA
jgi:hypothetical protein